MRQRIAFLTILTITQSCFFIRMDDSIDLGNKYRYVQDTPQIIIYHESPEYDGVGIEIVPPLVKSYKFDDRYIIAKTQEVDEMTGSKEGRPIHYWIVDKATDGKPVQPMDSVGFYQRLNELGIDLTL